MTLKHSVETENTRFQYERKTYFVNIKAFVCDAPARQFLKGIKAHNSYFGCERCGVEGTWNGRVVLCFIQSTEMKEVTQKLVNYNILYIKFEKVY